uniref:WD repeat domain 87 n=1 Tax=Sus scrofa TaxID=9823 RepID=A0A8D0XI52_PIG
MHSGGEGGMTPSIVLSNRRVNKSQATLLSQVDKKTKNDVVVLSDWPETLYKEPYYPESKPFICFYSTDDNYFVSLNWVEDHSKQMQAVLWIQKKDTEVEGIIEKIKFRVMDQVPPIQAMVHTGSYHLLIADCGNMHLWLFGDHHRAFIFLGTVPCRFSITSLCYDSETEMLLSGTLGAVVTWFILPGGKGLQMAQTVLLPGGELVQGFSLNGPQGSLLALCENKVRVFTHQGQGQLKEVKKFMSMTSGSTITCSFTCVSQGYFYAGNTDGEIHAWGLDRGNFLHSFQAHSSSVICIQSRPETHTLLTAGSEGIVKEWDLAVGNLLRQLDIDKDLQKLQFIDNTTFFYQTSCTFSLHHLPYFYSLFNVCGSAPQQVRRVWCGPNWTRILCATKDGLLRFLSPVTGDLLLITWPLVVMDKAVAWAYDSEREELFVATISSEVLVFDATRSPCTAKYLVCTSVNPEDTVRCLAYGQSHLGKGLVGLMFCGHESGIVRILSHYSCARIERTVHSGAVLALSTLEGPQEFSLLCSYGMDNIVHVTEAVLQKNKVILQPVSKIICGCRLKHVILLPDSVGAITENHCWRLWHYEDFLTSSESKQSPVVQETKCLHQCAITSFDVCLSLKLFVTGGIDGSVRIWDFHGSLITELDSGLHFGPLCFANNRGDLLLTFNESLYLVSCLKLLPPAQLIHLAVLNNADEIQESPKPFLPSFFFSFEIVFVPKFVYFGQGLQGLEALVNKRVIAFDNTVPHVVEEERHMSSVGFQEGPKLHFLEDKHIDSSTLNPKHHCRPHVVPAQLRLAGWDGLKPYHVLRHFFGQGRQWPFPPDGYIPNSVIRARLWPEGSPVFLHCDLYSSYQDKDWDTTELSRRQAQSPMTPVKEKLSKSKQGHKPKQGKQLFYDILVKLASQNWMGRKHDERLINILIEAILNLTVYCSTEQYKTYISVLAQIFAFYQIPSRWRSEAASRLLEDTAHSNPRIREIAWEGLEKLGLMSHLFAVPLAVGLMDSDENVRAKALYLMVRVTGIQTKSMLVGLLKRQETLQEMQQDFIGEVSLDQLLGIQGSAIRDLLTQVEERLNENLTLLHRDEQLPSSLDRSRAGEPEALAEQTHIRLSEPVKITKLEQRMTSATAKSQNLSMYGVTYGAYLGSTDTSGNSEALEITEEVEATGAVKAIDQHGMNDYGDLIHKLERKEHLKRLWKRALEKSREKVGTQLKEKKQLKDIPEITEEESKKEVVQVTEQENVKKLGMSGRGLSGSPGRTNRSDTRSWRDDICYLVTSRIASSSSEILRDLGQELVELAQEMLGPQEPSWDLFQEICPLLKDSSELNDRVTEETPVTTEKVVTDVVEEDEVVRSKEQGSKKALKKDRMLSQVKRKNITLLEDDLVLEKRKFKVKKLTTRKGKITREERKLSKQQKKLIHGKEKLTKDDKLIHQKEKIVLEEEILASSQKLAKEEQKLSLGEKKGTEKEEKLLGDKKMVNWKEGKVTPEGRTWDWEKVILAHTEGRWAQEEGLPAWSKRKLSHVEEVLGEEEGERSKEREEEKLGEEELSEEEDEEELEEEEEELGEEKEELSKEEEEEDLGEELSKEEEEKLVEEGKELSEEEEEEEELGEEEEELEEEGEELSKEEKEKLVEEGKELSEEEEEEEELGEEEEELGEEGEELCKEEEALILDLKKQVEKMMKKYHKKKKHIRGMEKHVEEEAQKREILAQEEERLSKEEEGLSGKKGKQALERGIQAGQEIKLTGEEKKSLVKEKKEAHKKKQIQEKKKKVEKEDQKERQVKREEKEAKDKQLAWKGKKLGLEGEEKFEEMGKLSHREDKLTQKKAKKTWEKEKREKEKEKKEREEKITKKKRQLALVASVKKMDVGEKEQAGEMETWSLRGKALEGRRKDWKKEKLAEKVEREAEGKKTASEKMKLAPKEEKKIEKIEKVPQREEKQVMEKEKYKKEEKWLGKDKKAPEEKKQWTREKEQLALQEEKKTQKESIWGQKEEKESDGKKQLTCGGKKLSLTEKEQAGEMEKRWTQEGSKWAEEERHVAEKEEAITREGISITKRKEKITQEEKEILEGKFSVEKRKLAYDIRTREKGVAKEEKKRLKEESIQAMRKLDMGVGISSEEKEASFREKDTRKKESHLLRITGKTIRESSTMPRKEVKILEEEQSLTMGRREIDGQRCGFFKKQEEITKETTLTGEERLEEDPRLLETVQEKMLLDKIQVKSMLKEVQKQNLLGKKQLKKLLAITEEKKPEQTRVKWLLENIRDILSEGLSESLIEKEMKVPTKKRIEKERLTEEGEEEEILPKKKKAKYPIKKEKKKVSLGEEELEAQKHKKKGSTQIKKEEERLTQEKEKLSKKKKEGPHEAGKELLSKEEWENLSVAEKEVEEEEESLSEQQEKEDKEAEERQAKQKDEESMSKEKKQGSKLWGVMLSKKERVLKTKLLKEEVLEGEVLAEERKGTSRKEMAPEKERLLYGKRGPTITDKSTWPTIRKSPFETQHLEALEKDKQIPLKVSGDHLDLEGQKSQLLRAHDMKHSWRRQDVLLEKARGMFLQIMETGLETQIPEGLHRPKSHLLDTIIEPQKPKQRPKGGRRKWFLKYQDSPVHKIEGQSPAPAPAPSFTSMPDKRPCHSEVRFSDEDWVNNALIRLEAGEQLSRDSFHRLSQLLKHFTSKRYLKWTHLSNLKTIAKHLQQNLQKGHTDISQHYKDVLSPLHLKVIPPIRQKEMKSWLEPFPIPEPVLLSAAKRTQAPQVPNWPLLAESYMKKQVQQLSTSITELRHLHPVRKDVPTAVYPSVDKESLSLDFQALRGRDELSKFSKAKKKALRIPTPVLPSTTKRIQDQKAITWHLLGEPYRSARAQQLSNVHKEMEMRHFCPATRDVLTGAHTSVEKQTLALMFQKDLKTLKGKGRLLKLPQLGKKAQPISKEKEEVPQWETFVALYHVLKMLQERYAKDSAAWMERFSRLMDLYQLQSPGIQRLLLELLQRKKLPPQETIDKKALKTKELMLGERLFCGLCCGSAHPTSDPLEFQDVLPLPGKNKVHTLQPVGVAKYGFLELAWKSLPQVNPYHCERLPNIPTPTL